MSRRFGFGLILLAAVAAHTPAWGSSADPAAGPLEGAQLFLSGSSGPTTAHAAQGYLGVDVRDVAQDQVGTLKLKDPRGAEIVLVDHDAPAGKAGLREHDVVLQINGQAVDGSDNLRRMLHESPPGKTIVLVISRDGMQMTISAQMANREDVERQAWEQHITVPEPPSPSADIIGNDVSAGTSSAPAARGGNSFLGSMLMNPSYTGAMLEKMSAQLAGYFGAPNGAGLLVRSVQPNSPAALAGMQAGDVVVRADARAVMSTSDWAKAIKNSHGHSLTIVVLREKKEQTLTLTPDGKRRSSLDDLDPVVLARLGFSWLPRS